LVRDKETLLRQVFEALPDPVLIVQDGVIVHANAAARRWLVWPEAGGGRPLDGVLAGDDVRRLELLIAQRAQGWPLPDACRLRFSRLDGTKVIGDARWSELDATTLVLAVRDVTEATRAEDLIGRLARLPAGLDGADALLDAAEPVFLALGWTVAFTEIVEGASIARRILSRPGDPVGEYGRTLLDRRVPRESTPILDEVVRRREPIFLDNLPTSAGAPMDRAIALTESMQRARVARSAWCPICVADGVTHLLAVTGPDITEHDFVAIQLFAALVCSALRLNMLRLEMVRRERLAAVGEMAAILAHEVRNPLAVMFNALSTLSRLITDPAARELLNILQQEAQRLDRLVVDLLDFAQPKSVSLRTTSLRSVVLDAVASTRHDPAYAAANPRLVLDIPEHLTVHTDAALLRQGLLNLLLNAVQHIEPGGEIRVSADRRDRGVAIVVSNDGPPVTEEVSRRMFEPFFTTKPRGTGLGLAIVRRICNDLGATVRHLPSARGAAFEILLPGRA
jgi:PAS domain S-box-containing protein